MKSIRRQVRYHLALRLAGTALALVAVAACTGGQRYGVPRTLAPGDTSHHVSADIGRYFIDNDCDGSRGRSCGESPALAPIPSYTFRIGLADRFELGAGAALDLTVRADLKFQLVRTKLFDVAVAPTLGVGLLPLKFYDDEIRNPNHALLPLLVGVRLGEVTLVPGGAIGYADTDRDRWFWAGSLTAFFPVSEHVLLGPGVTVVLPPGDDAERRLLGGLTIALGDSPG